MQKLLTLMMFLCFSSYSIAQSYTVNGSAKKGVNNVFQLTPVQPDLVKGHAGTMYSLEKIDLGFDFTINSLIYLGTNDSLGADGMAFILHASNTTEIGKIGIGLGCQGIKPSLLVEFDTYLNPEKGDLRQDHLAIFKNGDIDHTSGNNLAGPFSLGINIEDGVWHNATFSWNASSLTFSVSVLSKTYIYRGDIVNTIFNGNPSVYWGFTGGSGSYGNLQQVEIVSVKPLPGFNKDSIAAVPSAFTPNSNGVNDRLRPIPYAINTLTYFKVFNRWGQLVFETTTVGVGWDGTLKGKPQPTETYTWILDCISPGGTRIKKSGKSLLIR